MKNSFKIANFKLVHVVFAGLLSCSCSGIIIIKDASFGPNHDGAVITPIGSSSQINDLVLQPDNKIVAAGFATEDDVQELVLARYSSGGILDATFGSAGIVATTVGSQANFEAVALQTDGKIVAAGNMFDTAANFIVARYTTSGVLDATFGDSGITTTVISDGGGASSVALQADDKIVASGVAVIEGQPVFAIARFTSSGILDATFGTSGIVTTAIGAAAKIESMVLQADGKIVVAGWAVLNGLAAFTVARYNTDGTLDSTFGTAGIVAGNISGFFERAFSVALQSDGKIVVAGAAAGNFQTVRYNTDGSFDTGFGTGGAVVTNIIGNSRDVAHAVQIQADGKILVGGTTTINNENFFAMARYNSNGTLDTTFNNTGRVVRSVGTDSQTFALELQSDNKILMAGTAENTFALARFRNTDTEFIEITSPPFNSLITTGTFTIAGFSSAALADVPIFIDNVFTVTVQTDASGLWGAGSQTISTNGTHTIQAELFVSGSLIATDTTIITITIPPVFIPQNEAIAIADTTTASTTDVLMTGMSIVPGAGTYLAIFSTTVTNDTADAVVHVTLYRAGLAVAASNRTATPRTQTSTALLNSSQDIPITTNAVVTVDAIQAVQARWRVTAGTGTAHERTLSLIKLS